MGKNKEYPCSQSLMGEWQDQDEEEGNFVGDFEFYPKGFFNAIRFGHDKCVPPGCSCWRQFANAEALPIPNKVMLKTIVKTRGPCCSLGWGVKYT